MKKAGIVLLILQAVSLLTPLIRGDAIFTGSFANLIGRFIFGIVGIILIAIANRRDNQSKDE